MDKKRLLIIDSSALLYRAYHALPPLKTKAGQETGGIYGFLLTLFKAIKDTHATHVVACFDLKGKTFRHEQFAGYKAHRTAAPDGLVSQFSLLKEVVASLKIPVLSKEGFEADDVIATITELCKTEKDLEIFIVSGDLDNLQLVSEQVRLYTLGRGVKDTVIYDILKVKERFEVAPSQMNELKALIGDPSDNIPGVKGIGKKTAAELVNKFHTIAELYEELATDTAPLKPKVKEALKANKENALLSRQLVETKKDVPITFSLDDCRFGSFDKNELQQKLQELEFYSLATKVDTLLTPTP